MSAAVSVSAHAAQRYIERVNSGLTMFEAIAAIHRHDPIILIAIDFGCQVVRLGDGTRLLLGAAGEVVTVLSREWRRKPWVNLPQDAAAPSPQLGGGGVA